MSKQTQEALKMAIKFINNTYSLRPDVEATLKVCKEALEEEQVCQAQKPYGYIVEFDGTANPPEFYFEKYKAQNEANHCLVGANVKPVYTHPVKPWQGLTDDEIRILFARNIEHDSYGVMTKFARAIEAKLKEKNHGI